MNKEKSTPKKTCSECSGLGTTFSITPSILIECDVCRGSGTVLYNSLELLINVTKEKEQPDDV